MKQLRLEVLFGGKNKLSPALKAIMGSSNAASAALKKTRDQLRDLERQQERVATFRKLKDDVKQATQALEINKRSVAALKQQLATNPNSKLSSELKKAEAEAKRLNKVITEGRPKLMALRQELNATGLKSTDLAQHQEKLRNKIESANAAITRQQQHLKTLGLAQQQHQKYSSKVHNAAMYGTGAAMTGAGALYAMRKPIDESKRVDVEQNRIMSLGMGKEATEEALAYAHAMKTFGTSTLDNLTLVRDGVTAFADVHHAKMVAPMLAKMKFANEAMFGNEHGAENEKKFMDMLKVIEMRNGLKSEKAFSQQANMIQQVITATGGRVQAEEWLNLIKTGGIAAKGADNKAFYYTLEPLVQEMGGFRVGTAMMSAYQNLYQGRTTQRAARNLEKFGLIGDPSKVRHNKTGDLSYLDIGAIKEADLFKRDQFSWMEKVLLPSLAEKGITERGQVLDAIGAMFSNRTASMLFSNMYDQRENIHKNMRLNEGAYNIDQLNEQAKGSTTGKELEAKAKLHDAYLKFGTVILPVYTRAIEIATGALQHFTGWMERNPTLAKALGIGLLGIAASLVVIGGALVVFSPLILSMLSLRLLMASTASGATLLSRVFATAPAIFNIFKTSLLMVGRVFLWLGRALLMNPLGIAITLLATAAFLLYKNWEPIKAFFSDIWESIKTNFAPAGQWFVAKWTEVRSAFSGGIGSISALIVNWSPLGLFYSAFASVLRWMGIDLPSKFTGFGTMIIDGLITGIKSGFQKLKSVWTSVTNYMPNFLQKYMDIHSPSRVMAGLGAHIMGGIGLGLEQGFPALKEKFQHALTIFNPRASEAISKIDVVPALNKVRPVQAISPSRSSEQIVIQGDTITLQITQAPGQNLQQLQTIIENIFDRRDRQKLARIRSSFKDQEH